MDSVRVISACRVCGSRPLLPILSMGEHYVTNFVESMEEQAPKVPLELVLCNPQTNGCGLLQLRHTTPPDNLYGRHYWYRSGINQTMRNELSGVAKKTQDIVGLQPGDLVLDIGCNDGTLLRSYQTPRLILVGMDPAANLMQFAREGTTKILNEFFSYKAFEREFGEEKARAITAISMFYDLDDPNAFVADLKKCLAEEGVCIIQQNYLCSMLEQNAFDNIVHEHLEYYSLFAMENLLNRHGLEVFDVEVNDINGGSFRTYIRRHGAARPSSRGGEERVESLRAYEAQLGLGEKKIYEEFGRRAESIAKQLVDFVRQETAKGRRVYVYGASTRGNTTLQFCNLDSTVIKAAAERNPDKWGKKTVGTLIPIISEEQARAAKPDYFLVLPWHFLDEFKEREAEFLKSGGQFIVPLPRFTVVGWVG